MKDGIKAVVGKQISRVIVSENSEEGSPRTQIFLVFDDGTYYEIYGNNLHLTGGVVTGDESEALRTAGLGGGKVTEY